MRSWVAFALFGVSACAYQYRASPKTLVALQSDCIEVYGPKICSQFEAEIGEVAKAAQAQRGRQTVAVRVTGAGFCEGEASVSYSRERFTFESYGSALLQSKSIRVGPTSRADYLAKIGLAIHRRDGRNDPRFLFNVILKASGPSAETLHQGGSAYINAIPDELFYSYADIKYRVHDDDFGYLANSAGAADGRWKSVIFMPSATSVKRVGLKLKTQIFELQDAEVFNGRRIRNFIKGESAEEDREIKQIVIPCGFWNTYSGALEVEVPAEGECTLTEEEKQEYETWHNIATGRRTCNKYHLTRGFIDRLGSFVAGGGTLVLGDQHVYLFNLVYEDALSKIDEKKYKGREIRPPLVVPVDEHAGYGPALRGVRPISPRDEVANTHQFMTAFRDESTRFAPVHLAEGWRVVRRVEVDESLDLSVRPKVLLYHDFSAATLDEAVFMPELEDGEREHPPPPKKAPAWLRDAEPGLPALVEVQLGRGTIIYANFHLADDEPNMEAKNTVRHMMRGVLATRSEHTKSRENAYATKGNTALVKPARPREDPVCVSSRDYFSGCVGCDRAVLKYVDGSIAAGVTGKTLSYSGFQIPRGGGAALLTWSGSNARMRVDTYEPDGALYDSRIARISPIISPLPSEGEWTVALRVDWNGEAETFYSYEVDSFGDFPLRGTTQSASVGEPPPRPPPVVKVAQDHCLESQLKLSKFRDDYVIQIEQGLLVVEFKKDGLMALSEDVADAIRQTISDCRENWETSGTTRTFEISGYGSPPTQELDPTEVNDYVSAARAYALGVILIESMASRDVKCELDLRNGGEGTGDSMITCLSLLRTRIPLDPVTEKGDVADIHDIGNGWIKFVDDDGAQVEISLTGKGTELDRRAEVSW